MNDESEVSEDHYVPLGSYATMPSPHRPRLESREPWQVWGIALAPLAVIAAGFTLSAVAIYVAFFGSLIGSYFLARADERRLKDFGYEGMPRPVLAIVPFVYLAIRGYRKFDRMFTGLLPFWIHLALLVLVYFLAQWSGVALILIKMQYIEYRF